GLATDRRYILFPAAPERPAKRHDRAAALARACGAELLVLGSVEPARVPVFVNAADAVVVPSDEEGFGLAAIEPLAWHGPVVATPVGTPAEALAGIAGCLCAPFDAAGWGSALAELLSRPDPRVHGRERADEYSAPRLAARVLAAWQKALQRFEG